MCVTTRSRNDELPAIQEACERETAAMPVKYGEEALSLQGAPEVRNTDERVLRLERPVADEQTISIFVGQKLAKRRMSRIHHFPTST